MAQIGKQHIIAVIALAIAIAAVFVLRSNEITGAFGFNAITSGRLVFPNGTTAKVFLDNYSTAYVDNSVTNDNVYAELCSGDPSNDLLNNYLSLYILVGANNLSIGVQPVQMVASKINAGCAVVDADFSLFTSFYPAIIDFGVSNNSNMTGVAFYNLTNATGFLKGNFTIDPVNSTPTNLTINVRYPLDQNNNTYAIDYHNKKPIIVGVRNSSYDVVDSEITTFDNPVTLDRPNGTYIITINNIDDPGIFFPTVTIVYPTGQKFVPGTPVLIQANATGIITQVLINVTRGPTVYQLNTTFNATSGLWEVLFTNTTELGHDDIYATAYDINGNTAQNQSDMIIAYGAGPGKGGGSGGRGLIFVPPEVNKTNETGPIKSPPASPRKTPAVSRQTPAPVQRMPAVFDKIYAIFKQSEPMGYVCFATYLLTIMLIALLLIHTIFRNIGDYFSRKRSKEFMTWVLVIAVLAVILLNKMTCDTSSLVAMLIALGVILLLIFKAMFSQLKNGKTSKPEEPVINMDEVQEILKKTENLKKAVRKLSKKPKSRRS
ncbi:Uncharacterised protein [uncultured archaeon]|nr:Uncharacterised protein [uncultured archaeon]